MGGSKVQGITVKLKQVFFFVPYLIRLLFYCSLQTQSVKHSHSFLHIKDNTVAYIFSIVKHTKK